MKATHLATILMVTFLVACSADSEWVQITPGDVTGDVDISFGDQEVIGHGCGDGSLTGVSCFDPPIVPVGSINWLKINGTEIGLEDTNLEDGVLRSSDFGNFRFLISQTNRIDIYVQSSQLKRLENYSGVDLVK